MELQSFTTVRAALSKRLIEEKGFSIIAVEGDWPPSQHVNRYIKGYGEGRKDAREVLKAFNRWPTWMWANEEIVKLIEWLRLFNTGVNAEQKVGFYGIDVYSLWESMEQLLKTLTDESDLELAKKAFSCFKPFNRQPEKYARAIMHFSESCTEEVSKLFNSIWENAENYPSDQEIDLNIKVNALVIRNAEKYYRAMVENDALSWNVRDEHMVEAINELRNYHGEDAKILVWEHNTHIGDASATDMKNEDMINVGQLIREQNKKENVFAIGFGTYHGTVIAADQWGSPFKKFDVPPARKESWEDVLHNTGAFNKMIIFTDENRHLFNEWIGHRAIGVVYNPDYEAYGNYVPSQIGNRYDAFIYIDETKALIPIEVDETLI